LIELDSQKTLKTEVETSGVGLFTGEKVSLKIIPALPNTGIVFQRVDLPSRPEIPAKLEFVHESPRCTRLANGGGEIFMVEHLLSSLRGLGIDNARIEVTGPEIPPGDGSSQLFIDMIERVGLENQNLPKQVKKIVEPLFFSQGDVHLCAIPSNEFRVSYTLHYPESSCLGSQYYSLPLTPENFINELACCRTFSLYEEILPFIEKGIIRGGGLENALVIKDDKILNPGGARFPDEMVRHKILDLIGDLSLIGVPILGHIIAVRSGHSSNIAFARLISSKLECF